MPRIVTIPRRFKAVTSHRTPNYWYSLNHRAWFIDPVNDCNQNAEGVRKFQPRATPWENGLIFGP
jgi:hypothetical protein